MKTRLLITFIVVLPLVILIPQTSFSLLAAQTPEELYDSHHTIIKGKILDYTAISQRQTLYDVEVIEYVKNPQEDKTIQALGDGVKDAREGTSVDVIFDINDIVLLYLYHTDDSFTISPYSRIVEEDFVNPHTSPYETPSKVFDKTFSITQKQVKYVIPYEITSGTIDDMKLNCDSASLVLSISSSDAGTLQLDIPHRMLSAIFMVLVDGVEWDDEGETSLDGNTLTVNFPENTSKIEVLGAYYISPDKYTGVCDVSHNPPYSYIIPPLKQFKSGILIDEIKCKDDFVVVIKNSGNPACVKPETKIKLMERGWAVSDTDTQLTKEVIEKYGLITFKQYLEIQDWLQTCHQDVYTDEECDTLVKQLIIYPGDSGESVIIKPNVKFRGQAAFEVCDYLDLICPEIVSFIGIEKDNQIQFSYQHPWDDEHYEFIIENNTIKSVHFSGDNFER